MAQDYNPAMPDVLATECINSLAQVNALTYQEFMNRIYACLPTFDPQGGQADRIEIIVTATPDAAEIRWRLEVRVDRIEMK